MALLKTKIIERGEQVTYWRWIQQNRSDINKDCHYVLGGWKDKAERDTYPHQPRIQQSFNFNGEEYPFSIEALSEDGKNDCCIAYEKVKESKLDEEKNETNFFADAEDC